MAETTAGTTAEAPKPEEAKPEKSAELLPPVHPKPEPPPQPQTKEEISYEIDVIARRDPEKNAREIAQDRQREEQRRGKAWNPLNWARKFMMRNAGEYYVQKWTKEIRKAMRDNNNAFLEWDMVKNQAKDVNANREAERQAGKAVVERVKTGNLSEGEERIEAKGDLRKTLMEQVIGPAVRGEIKDIAQVQDILRKFVIDNASNPDVQAVFGTKTSDYGLLAEYFATDLLEVAGAIKTDMTAHNKTLEQLDSVIKINLARTSWGAETKQVTAVDNFIKKIESSRLAGWSLNPATLATVTSLGIFAGMSFARAGTTATAVVPGAGLLVGAAFAGIRRSADLKGDFAAHKVAMAKGGEIEEGSKHRERLEKFTYDTARASDLHKDMGALLKKDLTNDNARATIAKKAGEIAARMDLSALSREDLIIYDSKYQVEQGRLELTKDITTGRQALEQYYISQGTDPELARETVDALIKKEAGDTRQRLQENVREQNEAFTKYRRIESVKAGAFAAVAGLGVGLVGQQAIGLATGHGLQNPLDYFTGGSEAPPLPTAPSSTEQITSLALGHETRIPPGTHWIDNPTDPGGHNLVDAKGHILISNAKFDDVNNLTSYDEANSTIPRELITQTPTEHTISTVEQRPVLGSHGLWEQNTTTVDHAVFYANNTIKPDLSELGFRTIGHENGIIIDASNIRGTFQTGLNPEHIDFQDVVKSGKAFARFEIPGHGSVNVPLDTNAQLDLNFNNLSAHINPANPNSLTIGDFSKIVINQDVLRQVGGDATELNNNFNVWNLGADGKPGFISLGRVVEAPNGTSEWQSFSAITGTGNAPAEIPTVVQKTIQTFVQDFSLPHLPTPPVEHDYGTPFIPIPFAPRWPLERLIPPVPPIPPIPPIPPPYGYGYGGASGGLPPTPPPHIPDVARPADEVLGEKDEDMVPPIAGGVLPTTPTTTPRPTPITTSVAEASSPGGSEVSIEAMITNETTSPVELTDRTLAVKNGQEFVESEEIRNSETKGGITQAQAGQMYQAILLWLQSKNIPDAEKDDSSLNPTTYSHLLEGLKTFNGTVKNQDVKNVANLLGKFIRDESIDIEKGDPTTNAFAMALLYDSVKDLRLTSLAPTTTTPSNSPARVRVVPRESAPAATTIAEASIPVAAPEASLSPVTPRVRLVTNAPVAPKLPPAPTTSRARLATEPTAAEMSITAPSSPELPSDPFAPRVGLTTAEMSIPVIPIKEAGPPKTQQTESFEATTPLAQEQLDQDQEMRERLRPVLDKLASVSTDAVMGDILNDIDSEEKERIEALLSGAERRALQSPVLREIDSKIEEYKSANEQLKELNDWNGIVIQSNERFISLINTPQGPRVSVPANFYRQWRARQMLRATRATIERFKIGQSRTLKAHSFMAQLQSVLDFTYPASSPK